MKILTALLLVFSSICSFAQPLQVEWVKSIPGSLYEQNNRMAQAPCGDLYVVGFFQEFFGSLTSVAGEDGFIAKYNDQGVLQWIKQLSGTSVERVNGVVVADDHQIYIVGEFKGTYYYNNDSLVSQDQLDVLVAKIDSSGAVLWAKSGTGLGYESGNDISLSANGNLCITGYYENSLSFDNSTIQCLGLRDVFVATFDQLGNLLWLESLGGPAFEEGRSICTDDNDNIYITGSFRDFLFLPNDTIYGNGSYDAYVARYNNLGQLQWVKSMGGPASDQGTYIKVDDNQNIYAVGWFDRTLVVDSVTFSDEDASEEGAYLMKFDSNGNLLWGKIIDGTFDERAYAVDFDAANNIFVMGTLDSILIINGDSLLSKHLNRSTNIFVINYDENGVYKWSESLGGKNYDFCYDLLVKDATTFYIAGSFQDSTIMVNDSLYSQNGYDVFLGKFSSDTTVAVDQLPNADKQEVLNLQFFPNPCANISTLSYSLTQASDVKITLFDILGREQRTILCQNQKIGKHQIPIEKLKGENGVYFLELETKSSVFRLNIRFN